MFETPKIHADISTIIGNTPLVQVKYEGLAENTRLLVKLESENPGKSVKDRLAFSMIKYLEQEKGIKPGVNTLLEATSGNTGIALAMIGAAKGYKVILVMPESMSMERRLMFKIYGAEIILTPAKRGMPGTLQKVKEMMEADPTLIHTQQFVTPANAQIHYDTTGPEIWRDTDGKVDVLLCGAGTGGTVTGAGRFLKEKNADIKLICIEPEESPVISGGKMGPHLIQGIGAGFVPEVLDKSLLDEVVTVHSQAALELAREMPVKFGIACGISSGAAMAGAVEVAKRVESAGKTIVVVFPSHAERYLSTKLFEEVKEECLKLPTCVLAEPAVLGA